MPWLRPSAKPENHWTAIEKATQRRWPFADCRKDRPSRLARLRLADGIRQGYNHHGEGAPVSGRGCKAIKIQMKTIEELHEEAADNLAAWRATQFHRSALCFVIVLIVTALAFASLI